jgi:hypothetical protein
LFISSLSLGFSELSYFYIYLNTKYLYPNQAASFSLLFLFLLLS